MKGQKTYRALVPLTASVTFEAQDDADAERIAASYFTRLQHVANLARLQHGWMVPDYIGLMDDATGDILWELG